jgi:hypothetical protein
MMPNIVEKKEHMCQLFIKEQQERATLNETRTPENRQTLLSNTDIEELLNEALTSPPVEI